MFPIQLVTQLRQELEDRILDDICWPGRRPVDLAPLCGRLVQRVWLLPEHNYVWLLLETPVFADEPAGFLFRVDAVQGIRRSALGGIDVLNVYLAAGGRAAFMHRALDGRLAYESTVDELSEIEAEAVRWAVMSNDRRLPQTTLAQLLGIDASRAGELSVVWTRSGILESGGGRGHSRIVSERALALAGLS